MTGRVGGVFAWVRPVAGAEHRQPGVRVAREQYHRTLFLVIGFWALATCVAAAIYPIAAFGVAVLGIAHVVAGYTVERRRRAAGHAGRS
jgi:hypothetical protein